MAQTEDPLHNESTMSDIRRIFAQTRRSYGDNQPIKITISPKFYQSEQRTIYVCNILNLIDTSNRSGDNLLLSIIKTLLDIIDSANHAVRLARTAGQALYNIFQSSVSQRLSGSPYIRTISQFLGTTEQLAIEFFISSVFSTFGSMTSGVIGILASLLKPMCPFVSLIIQGVSLFFFYQSRKAEIEMKKGQNKILLLTMLFERLSNIDYIMDKNVLIVATDEFKSLFSFFRSNQGSWCDLRFIDNLESAPRARDIPNAREILQTFANIRESLSTNRNFDTDRIRRYYINFRQFSGLNSNTNNH